MKSALPARPMNNRALLERRGDESNKFILSYITHRPYGILQKKFTSSLGKIYDVRIRTSVLNPTKESLVTLTPSIRTLVRVLSLSAHSIAPYERVFLDSMDSMFVRPVLSESLVLEYSTCLPMELEWLKYPRYLVEYAASVESFALKHAALVTTPNELIASYAESQGAKRICLMPNYPLKSFRPRFASYLWRKKHGIAVDTKVVLFMAGGHMREIYGLDLLLESWRHVQLIQPNSLLLIIGPPGRMDLALLLRELKVGNVRAMGTVSHDELPDWVQIADCCVAPRTFGFPSTLYNDKDSTKISEYAALRKPVVATGYSDSDQYLLTAQNPIAFAEGILQCLDGHIRPARSHFWEDFEGNFLQQIRRVLG